MKIYCIHFVAAISLSFVLACGGSGDESPAPEQPPSVNQAPIFSSSSDLEVLEGSLIVGDILATDPDSQLLEFTIVGGNDREWFSLTTQGQLSFSEKPNFEQPRDSNADNSYAVEVSVTDKQASTQQMFFVSVNNALEGIVIDGPVNEALLFTDLNSNYSHDPEEISSNTRIDGTFLVAEADQESTNYSIVAIGGTDTQTGNALSNVVLMTNQTNDPTSFMAITPLTSLLSMTDDNLIKQQALTTLQLASSIDVIMHTNLWAGVESGELTAFKTQKTNQQLAMLLQTIIRLAGDIAETQPGQISQFMFSALLSMINDSPELFSLTDIDMIYKLFNTTIDDLNVEKSYTEAELLSVSTAISKALVVLTDPSVKPHLSDATQLLDILQTVFLNQTEALLSDNVDLAEYEAATDLPVLFADWEFSTDIVDTDGDQIPDLIDPDDDNDGVLDEDDAFPLDPTQWALLSTISVSVTHPTAIESTGIVAEMTITRTPEDLSELAVGYIITGNSDPTLGSASSSDYQIRYANGDELGESIQFAENESVKTLSITPLADNQREVPESLNINLQAGGTYELGDNISAVITIVEAESTIENRQLFLGTFEPQDGADTSASGLLTFLLEGDNSNGRLTYTYTNLGTQRTDQHLHLWPSGTIVHDIKDEDLESSGNVSDYGWDLSPGGVFTNKQQMLDALFNGEFYINIHSAEFPNGEIRAHLIYDAEAEPPEQGELSAEEVDADIIRFLNQATFGAIPEDYEALRSLIDVDGNNRLQVYELWIDEQFAAPTTSLLSINDHINTVFAGQQRRRTRASGFWAIALHSNDQLRHRVAFALSEVLVISSLESSLDKLPRGVESYWDMLAENAFSSYQQLLYNSARHPAMGVYLSHLRNSKAVPEQGYFPDENFAREVMQLFSFGLIKRNIDGSIILGDNNLPIPTYDNDVIKEMARVFTGLSLAYTQNDEGDNIDNTTFLRARCGDDVTDHYCWTQPMKFFPDFHDFGEKMLFIDNNVPLVIPAATETTESQAENELRTVIDAIVAHSSTSPFIARRLIQRFVTSNPSQGYIERVAIAFGQVGDMKSAIKAILLDPEARAPTVLSSTTFGKFKEPLLHLTSLMRLLSLQSKLSLGEGDELSGTIGTNYAQAELFDPNATLTSIPQIELVFGQDALRAPSVFNFFSPDFTPTGALSASGLVAPELKLVTESQVYAAFNAYNQLVNVGLVENPSPFTVGQAVSLLDYNILDQVWTTNNSDVNSKATALVDFIDFYLNAGKLRLTDNQNTRSELIEAIIEAGCESIGDCERYHLAVYGALTAPDFQVQQ